MDKSRLYFLLIILALLAMLGVGSRRAEVMLLAVPVLVYLCAAVYLAPQRVSLRASRSVIVRRSDGIEQADPSVGLRERIVPANGRVTVRVQVENLGTGLSELVIADAAWQHGDSLGTGASTLWEYTFAPQRGRYLFPDLQITAGDPFGLFANRLSVPAPLDGHVNGSLLTLPGYAPLRRVPVHPPLLRGFAGPVAARLPGFGSDFYGVRQYQPGDSLRRLNWRLSSRSERDLFTNQFEGERFADIGLILDARQSRNLISPDGELFEYGVFAAASLARAFLRDGHRVSLLVYGFSMERVLPGAGRAHGDRIERALAAARPLHNYALDDLNYLPTRMFPPRSQVVFVSPLGPEDFDPLVRLRALGYDVLVISPDPVQFELRQIILPTSRGNQRARKQGPQPVAGDQADSQPDLRLALRLAEIERALLVRKLGRFGVWVVDWRVDRPLVEALREGLAPLRAGQRLLRQL